ncbi:MAG: chemotaxis response regulator protein-glutamate methylesterase [Woeseia sp.]
MSTKSKIRVLVIDDSALMRRLLSDLLNSDEDIEVVGTANDPFDARAQIKQLNPDVLTLDVEMPKMDGLQFLSNLMRLRPMPVVMISSVTTAGAEKTLRALELGAVDFVSKPKIDLANTLESYADEINYKVKMAAMARIASPAESAAEAASAVTVAQPLRPPRAAESRSILALGASTGGTEAIRKVLQQMPLACPGIVIVQHIPPVFSASFASRLDRCCAINVCEARDGQQVLPGHAYIARGDRHLEIRAIDGGYFCRVRDGEPVSGHKPSVDVLFESVASEAGRYARGALLTGMGKDGAVGLLKLKKTGAFTVAQDEASSKIWGMPRAAIVLGAADRVLPLGQIAQALNGQVSAKV